MKTSVVTFSALFLSAVSLLAADGGLAIDTSDNLKSVLEQQTGQVVEVRLKNGDKLGGKIASVGDKLLHLSQLTGQEFFDAVVDVKDVSAVIVRTKK